MNSDGVCNIVQLIYSNVKIRVCYAPGSSLKVEAITEFGVSFHGETKHVDIDNKMCC